MNDEFLFIGGTRDGDRIAVPADRSRVELPLLGEKPRRKGQPGPTEIYERMHFSGETDSFYVFALRGISGNSVMRALIENYKGAP